LLQTTILFLRACSITTFYFRGGHNKIPFYFTFITDFLFFSAISTHGGGGQMVQDSGQMVQGSGQMVQGSGQMPRPYWF